MQMQNCVCPFLEVGYQILTVWRRKMGVSKRQIQRLRKKHRERAQSAGVWLPFVGQPKFLFATGGVVKAIMQKKKGYPKIKEHVVREVAAERVVSCT